GSVRTLNWLVAVATGINVNKRWDSIRKSRPAGRDSSTCTLEFWSPLFGTVTYRAVDPDVYYQGRRFRIDMLGDERDLFDFANCKTPGAEGAGYGGYVRGWDARQCCRSFRFSEVVKLGP